MDSPNASLATASNATPASAFGEYGVGRGNVSVVIREDDIIEHRFVQAAFYAVYTVIFALGVFGNALVCYVVLRNRSMQTVTNLFITNLALSDILLCAFAVPFTPLYTFLGRWIFGRLLCHLMPYAQGCSVYISTLTLTSIAVDRFFVIVHPFRPRMRVSTCAAIVALIWTFSLLVTFPYGWYMELQRQPDDDAGGGGGLLCEEGWPSERTRRAFGALTTIMQFAVPFGVVAFCYTRVSRRLNERARAKPGAKNARRDEAERERKRRTNRMLIAMVAIFGVSWLPLNVINVAYDFYIPTMDWHLYFLAFFLAHSLAMSSTCYNPFLYAWLNDNFRKEFKQVLPCFGASSRGGDDAGGLAGGGSRRRGSRGGAKARFAGTFRSEKTCNGNNDITVQESLLPSSLNTTCSSARTSAERKDSRVETEQIPMTSTTTTPTAAAVATSGDHLLGLIKEESTQSASASK